MKINGVEVQDANEKLLVKITKQDVRKGELKNSSACAAANALCRQHHADEARVHFSRAYIRKGKKWMRFSVPAALRNEIIAFDRGGKFEPGEYILAPVQPTVRLDAPTQKWTHRSKRKSKVPQRANRPKRPYHVASGVRARMMADWE